MNGEYRDSGVAAQMPRYKCHKEVWALKIEDILPGRIDGKGPGMTIVPKEDGFAPFSVGEAYVAKHDPQPGGYYVVYKDGYQSYSPAEAFEEGYALIR